MSENLYGCLLTFLNMNYNHEIWITIMNEAIRILKQHQDIAQKMVDTWSDISIDKYKEGYSRAKKCLKELTEAIEILELNKIN